MLSVADVSALIDRIYAAGETGEGWSDCLETIAEALGASGAHLIHYEQPGRFRLGVTSRRTDPAAIEAYHNYFNTVDPREARLPVAKITVGRILTGPAVLPHEELRRTEYYADFARPFGMVRGLVGATGRNADGSASGLSLNRADVQEEFDDEAVRLVSVLMPHLGRALQVRDRLAAAHQHCRAALDVLDSLPCAVILVDGHGRVCFANAKASTLLAKADGIAADAGRLRAANPAVTNRLRELCGEIAATRSTVPRHPGAALNLPRAHASQPLHVLIAPVRSRGALSVPGRDVAAVLYITDPEEGSAPDAALLRAWYGLTPAEARVAAQLAGGHSVEDIADAFRYTRQTARWYVKQVLGKTGCRTRTQFAARAASSIAVLRAR